MGEAEKQAVIECPLKYLLTDESGAEFASGEALAVIYEEDFSIAPKSGEGLSLSLRDILSCAAADYRIRIDLVTKEILTLFHLGSRFEDFLRDLVKQRNAVILEDMLMEENLRQGGIRCRVVISDEAGRVTMQDAAEVRFYDTALVVLPDKGELSRIPYSSIVKYQEGDYTLHVDAGDSGKAVFSQMGGKHDLFKRCLSESMNELSLKAQSLVRGLLPGEDPAVIRKVARFMKEGRAAKRLDIESVSPVLWTEMEKRLAAYGIQEEYDFLKPLTQNERACIGFKRGLLGDLTGEYIWFLMPVYSAEPGMPGNAFVMEAAADEGSGRATYVFRIMGRKDYAGMPDIGALHRKADEFIQEMNRCLIEINFRREPLYLPEEKLADPRYARYRYSILRLPSLRFLRERYIGRIVHASREQWQKDILDLLTFNVKSHDERAVWRKADEPEP